MCRFVVVIDFLLGYITILAASTSLRYPQMIHKFTFDGQDLILTRSKIYNEVPRCSPTAKSHYFAQITVLQRHHARFFFFWFFLFVFFVFFFFVFFFLLFLNLHMINRTATNTILVKD